MLFLLLALAAPDPARGQDPQGPADNDFGNNGENSVPGSAYTPGKKERESKEYLKENPDANKRSYYEKGGKSSNHDGTCRAKIAYAAARYEGPKNGYEAGTSPSPTGDDPNHKDGPRPKAGGGKFSNKMSNDPDVIVNNIYKYAEDVTYPKRQPSAYQDDDQICGSIDAGGIGIGSPSVGSDFMCIETNLFFASLVRELGFPVRDKNILPSFADDSFDTQTAGTNVWYGGKWHFFDPWESFSDTEDYLKKGGHAGYGGPDTFHDVVVWARESAPDPTATDGDGNNDYEFKKKDGNPKTPTGWKKLKKHVENGAKIETETFAMRIGVQDPLGRITGGATGTPLADIPASIYVPYDKLDQATHEAAPGPQVYGAELVTLLYQDHQPPGIYPYNLLVHNPTNAPQPVTVQLHGLPATLDVQVLPPVVNDVLGPEESRVYPFQVIIGQPLALPPPSVTDAHIEGKDGQAFVMAWSPVPGAAQYRLYASSTVFENPSEPGVQFLGTTTDPSFVANVPLDFVIGIVPVSSDDQTGEFDPEGGSTTVTVEPPGVPTLSGLGVVLLATFLGIFGIQILRRRRTRVA